jgi:hypothetical protein
MGAGGGGGKKISDIYREFIWAWSYKQKFSDLRIFKKKSENFEPNIFVRKVRKII